VFFDRRADATVGRYGVVCIGNIGTISFPRLIGVLGVLDNNLIVIADSDKECILFFFCPKSIDSRLENAVFMVMVIGE